MVQTKIKICGLRTPEDVRIVNRYRPDYAGFICCARFWRYVPKEDLKLLAKMIAPNIRKVGVFVDNPAEEVSSYINEGLIDDVQLHGQEDEEYIKKLRLLCRKEDGSDVHIIKAFRIQGPQDITRASLSSSDFILLDSGQGSGKTFDWRLIRNIGRNYFLAGGLNPDNLEKAVSQYRPYAVDISSGVETDRHKDESKVKRVIEIIRGGRI